MLCDTSRCRRCAARSPERRRRAGRPESARSRDKGSSPRALRYAALGDVEREFEIAFDPVERPDDQTGHLPRLGIFDDAVGLGVLRTRSGVADLDRAARAMNQALGMSSGRPTGMPAILGVTWKSRAFSKSGAVQEMQGSRRGCRSRRRSRRAGCNRRSPGSLCSQDAPSDSRGRTRPGRWP